MEVLQLRWHEYDKSYSINIEANYRITAECLHNVDDCFDIGMVMLDRLRGELLGEINKKREILEEFRNRKEPKFIGVNSPFISIIP